MFDVPTYPTKVCAHGELTSTGMRYAKQTNQTRFAGPKSFVCAQTHRGQQPCPMEQEWLPSCIQSCLKQNEVLILGRYSEVGAKLSRAIEQWRVVTRVRHAAAKRTEEWNESLRSGEFATNRKAMRLNADGKIIVADSATPAKSRSAAGRTRPHGVKPLALSGAPAAAAEVVAGPIAAEIAAVWDEGRDEENDAAGGGADFGAARRSSGQKAGTEAAKGGKKRSPAVTASKSRQLNAPDVSDRRKPRAPTKEDMAQSRKARASRDISKSGGPRASKEGALGNVMEDEDEGMTVETGEADGEVAPEASVAAAKTSSPPHPSVQQGQEVPDDSTEPEDRPIRLGLSLRDRLLRNLKAIGYSNGKTSQPVLSRYLVKWRSKARVVRVARARIQLILETANPHGEDMRRKRNGFEGFRKRCPQWVAPSVNPQVPFPSVHLDGDSFWARATRNEASYLHGAPFITKGVYTFAVRVSGVYQGMVVGVCDAETKGITPSDARAWGLHLTHGALYSKKQGGAKGVLSIKQLVDIQTDEQDEEDFDGLSGSEMGIEIEIEVDMDRRRIAFGKPGQPPVEAPVTLSTCVRPWALLWNSGVSVQIDARLQGSGVARMQKNGPGHRSGANVKKPAPLPLRAQAQWIIDPITGEKVFFGGGRPREFGSPRRSPRRSPRPGPEQRQKPEQPDESLYLPKFLQANWDMPSVAVGTSIKAVGMQDEEETGGLVGRHQRRGTRRSSPRRGARSPGRHVLARSPATPSGAAHSEGPNTPASWRQYALSARASPISPRTSRERSITHMVRPVETTFKFSCPHSANVSPLSRCVSLHTVGHGALRDRRICRRPQADWSEVSKAHFVHDSAETKV